MLKPHPMLPGLAGPPVGRVYRNPTTMRRRRFLQFASAVGAVATLPTARTASAQTALAPGTQAVVGVDDVNVRGGPGPTQPVVAHLAAGASVDLLAPSSDGAWWRTASDAGIGYVRADLLEPTGQSSTSQSFDLDLPLPYARQLAPIWGDPADVEM